jgi:parallel beta-helix repeat protein
MEQSSANKCANKNWLHDNYVGYDYDPTLPLPPLELDSNVFENNIYAIKITGGSEITVSANTIINNEYGIMIYNSHDISVIDNDIYDNTYDDIFIDSASYDNVIYHNNIYGPINVNVHDYGINNQWDNGLEGNWWSNNPNPTDANGDGQR